MIITKKNIFQVAGWSAIFIYAMLAMAFPGTVVARRATPLIKGVVTDSITGEPVGFANIYVKESKAGCVADENGMFSLQPKGVVSKFTVSSMGYAPKDVRLPSGYASERIKIRLSPSQTMLSEVIVKPKKEKYSKKNNPAVDLLERLRKESSGSDPRRADIYSLDKYDKLVLGLLGIDSIMPKKDGRKKRIDFLNEYIEEVPYYDEPVLKISVKEKSAADVYKKGAKKEIVTAYSSFGIDEALDTQNVQIVLEDVLREVELYANDITLMQNRLVSPFSSIATNYYKFYLDTLDRSGKKVLQLSFVPHNPESTGFNGKMLIPLTGDSTLFVEQIDMRVPKAVNLNFVENLYVTQKFERDSLGFRHKVLDDMTVELQIIPGTQKFYARRTSGYEGFRFSPPPGLEREADQLGLRITAEGAGDPGEEFWQKHRLVAASPAESGMRHLTKKMRGIPLYYWSEKIFRILVYNYLPIGKNPKFNFGPVLNTISYNGAEGLRLRAGGITSVNLSRNWFARAYVAYGFKDRRWKYGAELEYSFLPKDFNAREFPIHSVRANYSYDIDMVGNHSKMGHDNVFQSFSRIPTDLVTYRRLGTVNYKREFGNNFSFDVGFRYERQEASRWLPFERKDGSRVGHYNMGAMTLELRYAPGEKYVQTYEGRKCVNFDAWRITLSQHYAPKGFLGSEFEFNKTELLIEKRFWFSAFGSLDASISGAKVWSSVPFPSLPWPDANTSFVVQSKSFALMDPMEFAVDQYVSWSLTYNGNGILFNRIPWVKKLKLREIVTFKGMFGGLTDKNNPLKNDVVFMFPERAGASLMNPGTPYMEAGVGIDNILRLLRVDYVWRLTYRGMPGISKGGVRVGIHVSF